MLQQLRERGVLRVAASYAVIAWLILQIASVVFDPLGVPKWVMTALIVAAAVGLPVALALAWFLEIGAQGIERDAAADGVPRPIVRGARHYADVIVIAVLIFVVALLLVRQHDTGPPRPPAHPAIAVLPFENLGGDPQQEYFAEGLADEILNRLGRVKGLRVIARSSSFGFKGRNEDVRQIAATLGVTTLLEGSVQRDGTRLRLSARLVDAVTGQQTWSDTFDRDLTDVFEVQTELARSVVEALAPAAVGAPALTARAPASNLQAYDLYLLGKQAQWQRNPESLKRALNALERSAELDPAYAPTHAQLAITLWNAQGYTNLDTREIERRAEASAYRALALDPSLPEGHLALALTRMHQHEPAAAVLAELQRALALNPNYSLAMFFYSSVLNFEGKNLECRQWLERTLKVDPLAITARGNLIINLHQSGDDRGRDRELARFLELQGTDVDGMTALARVSLRFLDDPVLAAEAARKAMQLAPSSPTPGAATYLHRALISSGAYEAAAQLMIQTDWKTAAPDTWAYESALAAGSRPDLAGLDSAIESLQSLAPNPTRAAALLFWLTLAGRHDEAASLVGEAWNSGPLRTYTLAGLEQSNYQIAALWSLRASGRSGDFQQRLEECRRESNAALLHSPLDIAALLDAAALESIRGNDAAAMALLQRAFKRSALPSRFMPHLPWFARLAGRPDYDRLVGNWQATQAAARSKLTASPNGVPRRDSSLQKPGLAG